MIKITGQYTLDDFKRAQDLHVQTARRGITLTVSARAVVLIAGLSIFMVVLWLTIEPPDWMVFLIALGLILAIVYSQFIYRPRRLKRLFEQQKELSAPFAMEISEDGLHFSNSYGNTLIPWGDFVKWKENRDFVVLYRSDLIFHMIPKRLIASDADLQVLRGFLTGANVADAFRIQRRTRLWAYLVYFLLCVAIAAMIYFSARTDAH